MFLRLASFRYFCLLVLAFLLILRFPDIIVAINTDHLIEMINYRLNKPVSIDKINNKALIELSHKEIRKAITNKDKDVLIKIINQATKPHSVCEILQKINFHGDGTSFSSEIIHNNLKEFRRQFVASDESLLHSAYMYMKLNNIEFDNDCELKIVRNDR